jgi:hypothetical protein
LVPVCRGANPEPYWLIIRLRRCLATWALAAARGVPVRKVLRQRGWSKSTFYRKLDGGAARIAAILDERGDIRDGRAPQARDSAPMSGAAATVMLPTPRGSCPVRSGRYRPSCWRDPCRPRTDDAMPKSKSSRQTIKQVKARRS